VSDWFNNLFDIAFCKCKENKACTCPRDKKVPPEERAFLADQRGPRAMGLRGLDVVETRRRQRQLSRRNNRERQEAPPSEPVETERETSPSTSTSSASNASCFEMPDDGDSDDSEADSGHRNAVLLTQCALVADRYGISNRAAR